MERQKILTSEANSRKELEVDDTDGLILTLEEHDHVEIRSDDGSEFWNEQQDKKSREYLQKHGISINQSGDALQVDVGTNVGIHPLSKFTIIVNPKFSNIESLGRLIHFASGFADEDIREDSVKFAKARNQGLEIFIHILTLLTKKILRQGLYRTYLSVQEDIPYLRGKLLLLPTENTSGQLLNDARFNLQFSCEHDEYSANVLENQILLYTLRKCQAWTEWRHRKMEIRRLIHEIDYDVEPPAEWSNPISMSYVFRDLQYTQLNQRYRKPLEWCEFILKNSGLLNFKKRDTSLRSSFFVPMYELFQDFIAHLLQDPEYYPNLHTKTEYHKIIGSKRKSTSETYRQAWDSDTTTPKTPKWIHPDNIAYKDPDRTVVHSILDAKYKDDSLSKFWQNNVADLYQIAFYLNDYKTSVGYAILPKRTNSKDYEIEAVNQGLKIRVRHIAIDETLGWIFDKTPENTNKIKEMLETKFPY